MGGYLEGTARHVEEVGISKIRCHGVAATNHYLTTVIKVAQPLTVKNFYGAEIRCASRMRASIQALAFFVDLESFQR